MRKKLDTRFPAARIKKIMQADEDVGKIAMAVPLLVSKALELFLQDLCDRTYGITLQRGAKTMNSLHLKQCIQNFNVFDFLMQIVNKVPDLGGGDASGEDRSVVKRRKITDGEDNDSEEESKRSRMHETGNSSSTGRGRRRGRGRGRGRGSRNIDRELTAHHDKFEDDPEGFQPNGNQKQKAESLDSGATTEDSKERSGVCNSEVAVRNFDLNVDLDENGESTIVLAPTPASSSTKPTPELKHEEYPGWSLDEMEGMALDPIQLANLNRRMDEEEEDYDE